MSKFIEVFNKIIAICLLVAAVVVLVVSSLTTIYYDMHMDVDWPQYGKENIPLLGVLVASVLAVIYFLKSAGFFQNYKLFWRIGLGFITVYSLILIFSIFPRPVDDSLMLDNVINQFMDGDYSAITNAGGYLYIWPFQLGYVGFGQIMASVFGKSNYIAWDIVQLLCILITVYLIYLITYELFEDKEICGIVAFLSLGALFFYNYVTFIYGDILSMAPQTIALYMMVLYVKREKIRYAIFSAIAIALAIVIKTNCEVTLIALLMVLIGSGFAKQGKKEKEKNSIVTRVILAVIFLILAIGFKKGVDYYYCNLVGMDSVPTGSPAWSHIAMGLQESELEDGWYNGYNYRAFEENGFDTQRTKEAALENIKETLTDFAKRPLHACRFFARKFATQWADSVCISTHNLDLVSRHVENQPWLCDFLVFGTGSQVLIWVMNVFMTICYLGVAFYLIQILFKRNASPQEMLLLILIFGGMLFHEFWEGSSRYAMRYYIYWLPYAAYGYRRLKK